MSHELFTDEEQTHNRFDWACRLNPKKTKKEKLKGRKLNRKIRISALKMMGKSMVLGKLIIIIAFNIKILIDKRIKNI